MSKQIYGYIAIALVCLGIGYWAFHSSAPKLGLVNRCADAQTCLPSMEFTGNQTASVPSLQIDTGNLVTAGAIFASSTLQVSGTVTYYGAQTMSSSGTTTVSWLSTSATKGVCVAFNATSTNTLLNMTFAASSTAQTAAGVAPIISYGACN